MPERSRKGLLVSKKIHLNKKNSPSNQDKSNQDDSSGIQLAIELPEESEPVKPSNTESEEPGTQTTQISKEELQANLKNPAPSPPPLTSEPHHPSLVLLNSDQSNQSFPLIEGKALQVGRQQADIIISHPSISTRHCTLTNQEGIIFLMENGSSNGTFVNAQKIRPHHRVIVDKDDDIHLGLVKVQIYPPFPPKNQPETQDHPSAPVPSQAKPQDQLKVALEVSPKTTSKKVSLKHRLNRGTKQEGKLPPPPLEGEDSPESRNRLAHPLTRLIALIADLSIGTFLGELLMSRRFFIDLLHSQQIHWESILEPLALSTKFDTTFLAQQIFISILLPLLLRLLCIGLWGVSLGQAALGLRGGHGPLRNRLGGVIRLGWELILGAFVIFDLPLLLGRRSAKEWLSGTVIINGPSKQRIIAPFILLPLAIILPQTDGFITQWQYRQGLAITKYRLPPLTKPPESKPPKNNAFLELTSEHLQLTSFPLIDEQQFWLLLSYDIISQNKKKVLYPRIALYDRKAKQQAYFKVHSSNIVYQALRKSLPQSLQPRRGSQYPRTMDLLSRPQKVYAPAKSSAKWKKVLDEDAISEIKELLKKSLSFNTNNLIDNILLFNYDTSQLLKLRQIFLEKFNITPNDQVQFVNLNNHQFLKINIHPPPTQANSWVKEYFIPIDTFNGLVYELTYPEKDRGKVVALKLMQYLFGTGGRFYFDEPWPFPPPSTTEEAQATLGQCIDALLNPNTNYSQLAPLYQRYLNHLDQIAHTYAQKTEAEDKKSTAWAFLLGELSSLSELERFLIKKYPAWAENFSDHGFQYQLERMNKHEF